MATLDKSTDLAKGQNPLLSARYSMCQGEQCREYEVRKRTFCAQIRRSLQY